MVAVAGGGTTLAEILITVVQVACMVAVEVQLASLLKAVLAATLGEQAVAMVQML